MTTNQNEHRNTELCRALAAELENARAQIASLNGQIGMLKYERDTWHSSAKKAASHCVSMEGDAIRGRHLWEELQRGNALNGELMAALKKMQKYAMHKHTCAAINHNKTSTKCDCGITVARDLYAAAIAKAEEKP